MIIRKVSNYDLSNFDAKYEGLGKYDILALDKCFVVTLWVISIPGPTLFWGEDIWLSTGICCWEK